MQTHLEPGFEERLRQDILDLGFLRDELLATERDVPAFGAFAWPFPESLREQVRHKFRSSAGQAPGPVTRPWLREPTVRIDRFWRIL